MRFADPRRIGLLLFAFALSALASGCIHARGSGGEVRGPRAPPLVRVDDAGIHTVVAGETLFRIARDHGLTVEALLALNPGVTAANLAVGTVLRLSDRAPVAKAAAPDAAQARPRFVPSRPNAPPPRRTWAGCQGKGCLEWPLRGVIYARFGKRGGEQHEGLDLAAPEGSPIGAAAEGTVIYAGEQAGYGKVVIVQHAGDLVTVYAHNRENVATEGQKVQAHTPLAKVGTSGRTSGPHVHFEVRKGATPVDPVKFLADPMAP